MPIDPGPQHRLLLGLQPIQRPIPHLFCNLSSTRSPTRGFDEKYRLTLNKFPKTVKHSMRAVLLYPAGRPLFTARNAGSKADVAGGGRRHYHITRNTMIPCQRPVPMSENDPRVPLNVPNEDGSVAL